MQNSACRASHGTARAHAEPRTDTRTEPRTEHHTELRSEPRTEPHTEPRTLHLHDTNLHVTQHNILCDPCSIAIQNDEKTRLPSQ